MCISAVKIFPGEEKRYLVSNSQVWTKVYIIFLKIVSWTKNLLCGEIAFQQMTGWIC